MKLTEIICTIKILRKLIVIKVQSSILSQTFERCKYYFGLCIWKDVNKNVTHSPQNSDWSIVLIGWE